jgi:hypothetical protein
VLDATVDGRDLGDYIDTPLGPAIDRYMYYSLFCRNTKKSIGNMYKVRLDISRTWVVFCPLMSVPTRLVAGA